jgi:phosphatidylethanolamine-binding protein (PEBP) family uncharacterized protein
MEGGEMASVYTCDGPGGNPAMTWSNPPAGTKEYAILMTTPTPEGSTKWNWVLWGIPASSSGISKGNFGIGYNGRGSDGAQLGYQAPCSQGTGTKSYTFTLYALSEAPAFDIPAANVTGDLLLAAISRTTLGKTSLNLKYTRTANSPGYSTPCKHISDSMKAGGSTSTSVGCDANYAYINSNGLPDHIMMDGIAATNLQVPTAQNFQGSNAWRIPLAPVFATTPTSAIDGPIGIAVNGVPIFNPCKQGGCQNGDTKVQGELDICNGHAGRADDYHYHAAPVCLMAKQTGSYWDTNPLGWALDGYAIMGYHGTDGKTAAPRDAICGGTDTLKLDNIPAGYSYHVTEQSPYILSCFRGVPSPDLAGQASKYAPMRQPPVTPFPISRMTLTTDSSDGYQVLQFTSTQSFVTTETGSDQYNNRPGTYRIRYKAVTGSALTALLAQNQNIGKTACWSFIFTDDLNGITQPGTSYCR